MVPWIATYVELKTIATTENRPPTRGSYYGLNYGHAYGAHGVLTPITRGLSGQHRRGNSTKYPRIFGSLRARSLAPPHRGARAPLARQGRYFTHLVHRSTTPPEHCTRSPSTKHTSFGASAPIVCGAPNIEALLKARMQLRSYLG